MRQGPVGVLEVWDHAFPLMDFSSLNLPSCDRFLLASMIPSAATSLYLQHSGLPSSGADLVYSTHYAKAQILLAA